MPRWVLQWVASQSSYLLFHLHNMNEWRSSFKLFDQFNSAGKLSFEHENVHATSRNTVKFLLVMTSKFFQKREKTNTWTCVWIGGSRKAFIGGEICPCVYIYQQSTNPHTYGAQIQGRSLSGEIDRSRRVRLFHADGLDFRVLGFGPYLNIYLSISLSLYRKY